ncbi:MAG TPA: pitrilysin family protein [Candidatus Eisenbacteria bacterium]|nr:pitrilysin family protein [Candidatus Eisenbacteria bacterium]
MRATRLPNGIRVLSEELPDLGSVTVGIWVENGSRYERVDQAGISHFLEHLFFKGTERRTAAQIAEEIDAVGGVLNAFTGKEYTCYYAKVLDEHLPLALDLLADVFTHSRFAEDEIERERTVITQEISQIEDTPDDYVHDLFALAFWPDHPLARPIAGTAASVSGFHRPHFLDFLGARYRPDRIIVAGAGNLRHDALVDVVATQLGPLQGITPSPDGVPPTPRAGLAVHEKDLEQVHLCLGTPGLSQGEEDRYAAHLLNLALGGGMSSRLFQEIRERQGKAYTVYSFLTSYRDTGYLGVYLGTSPQWTREVVATVRAELARVTRDGLAPAELARAKTQMKGSMLLGLETSDSRMSRIAKNEIYYGRDVPIGEVAARFDAVTNDDVVRIAERLFGTDVMTLTVLGNLKGESLDAGVLVG